MSSVGLKVGLGEIAGVGSFRQLKKEPVGKYIASVFDFFPISPNIISNPNCVNVLFMISRPLIMPSLVANRNDPSSR